MIKFVKSAVLVSALALSAPLYAQENTNEGTQQPAELPLSMGQELNSDAGPRVGDTFTAETFGDWEIRCVKVAEGKDPCQLYQLLRDQGGNAVAEFNILALPADAQAAAGANLVVPLETLLTEGLTLAVDTGQARRYPFTFCAEIGCLARVGFTAEEVASFRRGNAARITIVPALAPDQRVELSASLTGFTAGFKRLQDILSE